MLVIQANWTDGALWLWAESSERYQSFAAANAGGVAAPDDDDAIASTYAAVEDLDDDNGASPHAAAAAVAVDEATSPRDDGPADDHPFALPAADLAAALAAEGLVDDGHLTADGTMSLRLPTVGDRPVPSDRLRGVVGADEPVGSPGISVFAVPRLQVRPAHALLALLRLEERGDEPPIEFGHSLRYWMMIARLVLELLEDQRFIPTLVRTGGADLHARWQPWLHDDEALARLGDLLQGMPPVVRAVVDAHDGQPWLILDEAMRVLTDATVRDALIADDFADAIDGRDGADDAHVAWLNGLLGAGDRVRSSAEGATELLRVVGGWIGELTDAGQDRPLRLCLRLTEPPPESLPEDLQPVGDDVRWRLSLHLMGPGRDPVVIDAEQVWSDPAAAQAAAGGRVRHPEELLLAELGRAARVYPAIEAALSEAAPTGIDLTTAEASAFLAEHKDLLEESGFAVIIPDWWGQSSARLGARLQIEAPPLDPAASGLAGGGSTAAGQSLLGLSSLVRYRWQVAVGDQLLAREEFEQLTKQNATLVRLHGQWVELRPDEIAQAASFFDAEPSGELSLMDAIRLAHGSEARRLGLPVVGLDATGWVGDLLGASSGAGTMPVLAQPTDFIGTLRPYQEVGLSWLAFLDQFGLGACLADDMGLGKTIQLIALLLAEREQVASRGAVGPTLLVVPTSVVGNWERELSRFAPTLRRHVHHGPDRPVGDRFVEAAEAHDVVITTYTLVSRDREVLERVHWHRVVLDEAQYIKNPPTKQTATIRALRTTRRIALTGTPVENRLSELWSIIEFCNPGYLGPPGEFRRRFAVPIERHRDQERAEQLRRLVRPFVLRRLKTDPAVITDLPPCVVTKEYATLTAEQAALYERTVNSMLNQVSRAEGIQRRGLVLATLVKLKQICNHPVQVDKSGDAYDTAKGARGEITGADRERLALLSRRSGKATRLMRMMEEVLAAGHRALLFTQFRRMGHLLAAMIRHDLDAEVQFLHGGTPPKKRQQMIDRFQDPEGDVPIFILSLKAGGIGVNLTAANHVFHFDRWWNPAVENQATDRAFRIGQTRTVHVHKFVCQGTLEERIDQMIEQKTELARNIIGAGEDWLADLTTGELRELLTLRHTAMEGEA